MTKTHQEIFNIVAKHLLTQNKRCAIVNSDEPRCLYRGKNGLKCAIGVLIPDSIYSKALEDTSAHALPEEVYVAMDIDLTDNSFLDSLQHIHDYSTPNEWKKELIDFAARRNLDSSVCL